MHCSSLCACLVDQISDRHGLPARAGVTNSAGTLNFRHDFLGGRCVRVLCTLNRTGSAILIAITIGITDTNCASPLQNTCWIWRVANVKRSDQSRSIGRVLLILYLWPRSFSPTYGSRLGVQGSGLLCRGPDCVESGVPAWRRPQPRPRPQPPANQEVASTLLGAETAHDADCVFMPTQVPSWVPVGARRCPSRGYISWRDTSTQAQAAIGHSTVQLHS